MGKIGVLSTWNVRCGIAEYSTYLVQEFCKSAEVLVFTGRSAHSMHDEPFVSRCWDNDGGTVYDLIAEVIASGVGCLIIQYHPGFYSPQVLATIIDSLEKAGVCVCVIFHAIYSPHLPSIAPSLRRAALNVVHQQEDAARFESFGVRNVEAVPHAVFSTPPRFPRQPEPGRFRIGTFGFLMAHKGYLQLMAACHLLKRHIPNLELRIHAAAFPGDHSDRCLSRCRAYMDFLDCAGYVQLDTSFVRIEEAIAKLQCCDLLVFPYQCSKESASGAARIGLASHIPVMCTPLPIFADMASAILTTRGFDPLALADSILEAYRNPQLLSALAPARERFLEEHSWSRVAGILLRHVEELAGSKPRAVSA